MANSHDIEKPPPLRFRVRPERVGIKYECFYSRSFESAQQLVKRMFQRYPEGHTLQPVLVCIETARAGSRRPAWTEMIAYRNYRELLLHVRDGVRPGDG